jgi:N-acetylmuramoyl-L-alanine amidase
MRALAALLLLVLQEDPSIVVRELRITERSVTLGLELPARVPLDDLPPAIENRIEVAVGAITALEPSIDSIHLLVAHPGERLQPPPSRPPLERGSKQVRSIVPDPSRYPFGQALLGKTVALSPGHGWIYFDALGGYGTQRGNVQWTGCGDCRGITEDFETHEIVIRWLIPLLEGAGARVILVRERDYSDEVVVIDDGDPGYAEISGAFADGAFEGGNGTDYRTSFDPGATAEWTLSAPTFGERMLSLWFVPGANRLQDARLEVEAAGVRRDYLVDLTAPGRRWAPIHLFDLRANDPITVRLSSPLGAAGDRAVIADAVRWGAGKHESDHPWWQMGAEPFAAHQQAPPEVLAYGDVTIRPRYAEFYGADAYVSVHSNASGQADSTAAGTSSYRYNCGVYPDHSADPSPQDCDDPGGSDRLQALVHQYLVEHVRADWDPNWLDRGPKVANFGELRELDGIPGVLIESAFHDNVRLPAGSTLRATDNQSLQDPRWRRAAAYGIYRGISEFLVGPGPILAQPPKALALKRIDRSSVSLEFDAVPEAKAYRVYVAIAGRNFDQGRIVMTTTAVIDGLPEGASIAVKVASLGDAGEGPASKVVVARAANRRAQVLIVDAFEREDAWVQEIDNRGDTSLAYALAAAPTEYAFDGTNETAIAAGMIQLEDYDGIVLALGRESTEHEVLTAPLRDRLRSFVAAGGAVFASGSEIAWALDAQGDDASRAFLDEVFGARLMRDDANAGAISGTAGGWLDGVASPLASVSASGWLESKSPDVLAPNGGVVEMIYGGQDAAAVRSGDDLLLGIGLDSVADLEARERILGAWLTNAIDLVPEDVVVTPDAGLGFDTKVDDAGEIIVDPDAGAIAPEADTGVDPLPQVGLQAVSDPALRGGCGCTASREGSGHLWMMAMFLYVLFRLRRAS